MAKKEVNPTQFYLFIVIGIFIILSKFIKGGDSWSNLDYIKICFGSISIGFGIYKLITHKKENS